MKNLYSSDPNQRPTLIKCKPCPSTQKPTSKMLISKPVTTTSNKKSSNPFPWLTKISETHNLLMFCLLNFRKTPTSQSLSSSKLMRLEHSIIQSAPNGESSSTMRAVIFLNTATDKNSSTIIFILAHKSGSRLLPKSHTKVASWLSVHRTVRDS